MMIIIRKKNKKKIKKNFQLWFLMLIFVVSNLHLNDLNI
jgi:hypothetical protein